MGWLYNDDNRELEYALDKIIPTKFGVTLECLHYKLNKILKTTGYMTERVSMFYATLPKDVL